MDVLPFQRFACPAAVPNGVIPSHSSLRVGVLAFRPAESDSGVYYVVEGCSLSSSRLFKVSLPLEMVTMRNASQSCGFKAGMTAEFLLVSGGEVRCLQRQARLETYSTLHSDGAGLAPCYILCLCVVK